MNLSLDYHQMSGGGAGKHNQSSKSQKNLYFSKNYRLLIHSVTYKSKINASTYSEYASRSHVVDAHQTIYFDDVIDVCVLDVVNQTYSLQSIDTINGIKSKEVELTLYKLNEGRRQEIATCFFDLNLQKIVKEQSKQYMKMNLSNNQQGYIQYKFISLRTRQINFQEFQQQLDLRNEQMKAELEADEDPNSKALRDLIQQKNKIIQILQTKVHQLTNQLKASKKQSAGVINAAQSSEKAFDKSRMNNRSLQKRPISLNVKISPSQQQIQQRVKKYKIQNQKIFKQLEDIIKERDILQKDNELMNRQISVLKKLTSINQSIVLQSKNQFSVKKSDNKESKGSYLSEKMQQQKGASKHQSQRKFSSSKNSKDGSLRNSYSVTFKDAPSIIQNLQNIQQDPDNEQSRVAMKRNKQQIVIHSKLDRVPQRQQKSEKQYIRQSGIRLTVPNGYQVNRQRVGKSIIYPTTQIIDYANLRKSQVVQNSQQMSIQLEKLKDQNSILSQKIKFKENEINKLKDDLEYYIDKVKSAQRNVQDIRQTSKSMHIERMEAIKSQRQQAIRDLQGASRNSPSVQFILYKEKVQNELENLRFQLSVMRQKNRQLNQYKAVQDEREKVEITKANRQIATLKQQKVFFQTRYNQVAEKYRIASEQLKKLEIIQYEYTQLKELFHNLAEQNQVNHQKRLQLQKLKNQNEQKIKTLSNRIQQRQGEWAKLKMVQTEYQAMKKKIFNLQKNNQRFQRSFSDVKKYASKIQGLYYELKRNSTKNQDQRITENLQKQLKNQLSQISTQVNTFFKQFYQNQQQTIEQQKRTLHEQFSNKNKLEMKIIDQKIQNIEPIEKQRLKQQKINEVKNKKEKRLKQLQDQMKRVEDRKSQFEQSIQKINKSILVARIKALQMLVKGFEEQKKQWAKQKQNFKVANMQLEEKLQQNQSKLIQNQSRLHQNQLTLKKNEMMQLDENSYEKLNPLVKSQVRLNQTVFIQNRQHQLKQFQQIKIARAKMVQDLAKNKQNYTKQLEYYNRQIEDMKKNYTTVLKQKSQAQIALQNYKFQSQRTAKNLKESSLATQRVNNNLINQKTRQIEKLLKNIESISTENAQMKEKIKQHEQNIQKLLSEIQVINNQCLQHQQQIIRIEDILKQKNERLSLYEQAEKSLLHEVQNIKDEAFETQKEFKGLIKERDQQFIQIQGLKNNEIQKLNKTIEFLQTKLQAQVMESLKIKRQNDTFIQSIQMLESKLMQIQQALQISKQTNQKNQLHYEQIIRELQNQNLTIQKNLIEIAEQISQKQLKQEQLNSKIQALHKEINLLTQMQNSFTQRQNQYNQQKNSYRQIIEQEQLKLKQLQDKFDIFSQEISKTNIEYNNALTQLQKLQVKYQDLQAQLKVKQRKIMQYQVKLQNFQGLVKDRENQLFETVKTYKNSLKEKQDEMQQMKIRISQLPFSQAVQATKRNNNLIMKKNSIQSNKSGRSSRSVNSFGQKNGKKGSKEKVKFKQERQKNQNNQDAEDRTKLKRILSQEENLLGLNKMQSNKLLHKQSEVKIQQPQGSNTSFDQKYQFKISDPPNNQNDSILDIDPENTSIIQQNNEKVNRDQDNFYQNSEFKNQLDEQNVKKLFQRISYLEQQNQSLQKQLVRINSIIESPPQFSPMRGLNSTEQDSYQKNKREGIEAGQQSLQRKRSNDNYIYMNEKLETKEQESNEESQHRSRSNSQHNSWSQKQTKNKNTDSGVFRQRKYSDLALKESDLVNKHKMGSQGHFKRQQEYDQLQLTIQELQIELTQAKKMFEQQKANNERLMNQLLQQAKEMQKQSLLIEDKQNLIEQIKQEYQHQKTLFQEKIQEVVSEMLQKQNQIAKLMKDLEEQHTSKQNMESMYLNLEQSIEDKNQQIQMLNEKMESSRRQFRKYQEQAELEILSLKQKIDSFAQTIKQKHNQIQVLAEKYLTLQEENKIYQEDFELQKQLTESKQTKIQNMLDQYQKTQKENRQMNNSRKQLLDQIQSIEGQKMQLQNTLGEMNKSFGMSLKKHKIEIESYKQHIQKLKLKIVEKDEHLVTLKGQISHYNDQCEQLKRINNNLNLELQKVQKSLKDIMVSYQDQLDQINKKLILSDKKIQQFNTLIKQKDDEMFRVGKQIRGKDREIQQFKSKISDISSVYEKFKNSKNNQIQGYVQQYSYKQDEFQKLRLRYQKDQQEWFNSECNYLQQKEKYQQQLQICKQKLSKYQTAINDLSTQILKQVEERPTKQAHDEIVFENQMFKNRIRQMQDLVAQKHSYVSPKVNEQISQEYRRYKIAKQNQLTDLESEIQKYCAKTMQLEQCNYELRKQIDRLRDELLQKIKSIEQMKQELEMTRQQLDDAKSQMQFYQRKRNQQLNKLLNQTFE